MSSDPIICHCDESFLPHIHRNPPYDTDGRNEMHRKKREEHVVVRPTLCPTFEPVGAEPDAPLSPNEQERLRSAKSLMEICDIELSRGDCENKGCRDEQGHVRRATLRVGRYNLCEICADERDRGNDPATLDQRIRLEDLK